MSNSVPTTRYFAVGFFTGKQLEERDRNYLNEAATGGVVPIQQSAIWGTHVTVWNVDTGAEKVGLSVNKLSMAMPNDSALSTGGSFSIERLSSAFPGSLTPQEAFDRYLASPDGVATFGKATAVQLFSVDVDAAYGAPGVRAVAV